MLINITNYLKRICYQGSLAIDEETLKNLHRHHVLSIPFENLDVHLGKNIALDEESLNEKIIYKNRGGYCYEMNGLFAIVLKKLGFKVSYLNARVLYNIPKSNPLPRTHMLLKVETETRLWICDVGFGGNGLLEPILLAPSNYVQKIGSMIFGEFQLRFSGMGKYILATKIKDEWKDLYEFSLEEYLAIDFVPANYFQSNSPEAPFTNKIFCTIPTETGRVILDGLNLKKRDYEGGVKDQRLTHAHAYQNALRGFFNIDVDVHLIKLLRIKTTNQLLFLQ